MLPDRPRLSHAQATNCTTHMLDRDLAALYGTSTKVFNQAVKRNEAKFPSDFRFQLTQEERQEVVTNRDHLKNLKYSPASPTPSPSTAL